MIFKSLRLRGFRNLHRSEIRFAERINLFLGDNGQGKTNLLEALTLCCRGDSFRSGENEVLIERGQEEAVIEAELEKKDLDYQIRLQILKSKKNAQLNFKKTSAAELRRLFPSVIFSPESLSAIKDGADQRRELVDELLVSIDPARAPLIAEYRKALRSRNRLLKDGVEGIRGPKETEELLESIDPSFLKLGTELTEGRLKALRDILSEFNNAMQYISEKSPVEISVEYSISDQEALQWDQKKVLETLTERARQLRSAELSSGLSLVGPHKHDIKFLYGLNDSRFFCSQGQQRAIILAFKMAQIVYHRRVHGIYPVLMLDDVLSELDESKRQSLICFLHEIQTQTFVTTTDIRLPDSFTLGGSAVFRLDGGRVNLGHT